MKLLTTSVNNVIHCQSCECLYEYEENDIQYTNRYVEGNTGKPRKELVAFIECPVCHSQFKFYDMLQWEED